MSRSTGDRRTDAALRELDPRDAELARAAVDWLTGGEGLDTLTLHGLATFLWYSLPVKWLTDLDEKLLVTKALAELFTRLGRPRYAALSDSAQTRAIIAAYEGGTAAGKQAYRKAMAGSGLEPADVPGVLTWGAIMGGAEYEAFRATTVALEKAMDEGLFKPGAAGWRTKAQQVTERLLNSPREDVPGTTWLQWMNTDRLQQWVETGGATRRRLAAAVADGLLHPVPTPADAVDHIGPLLWLLEHAAAGAPLTESFYLARSLVVEAAQRFGWQYGPKEPRTEAHVVELVAVREFLQRLRWVRRSQRTLLLTSAGRAVLDGGPDAVWQGAVPEILGESDAQRAAGEVAAMLLLSGDEHTRTTVIARVAEILREGGWRDAATGESIDDSGASWLYAPLSRHLEFFGFWKGPTWLGPLTLNESGRTALLTALRARALRPRTTVD